MGIGTEILVILLLALLNGVLSMAEIALVSARKVRLRQRAEEGDRGAAAALALAEQPGRFLSTVQIGITLIGIVSGVFGGASVAAHLAALLARVPVPAPYSGPLAVTLVICVITYLNLVLGELVPKQLGLAAPERLASLAARPLGAVARLASPLVAFVDGSAQLLLRVLPGSRYKESPVTEEEIDQLLSEGTVTGVFEVGEQAIVARAIRLGERRIGELATPRAEMVALDANEPAERNWEKVASAPHVYFPVYESVPDRVIGIVSVRDLWQELREGRQPDLRRLVKDPLYLPESISVLRALSRVRSTGRHVALVLDEHGGIEGLVTLHDLLQAIVGELPSAPGPGDDGPPLVQRADGSWLVDGRLGTGQLAAALGLRALAEEHESRTVGGLVMELLGRLPRTGDLASWEGHRLEVVDMDGRRVDKVLASVEAEPPAGAT